MKTKIAIAVTLGVLFVAVPSATPKGRSGSGLTFSVICDANDACALTGSGFARSPASYGLAVTDSCGGTQLTTSVNPDGTGAINTSIFVGEAFCPGNTAWTFTLSTLGKRSSTVATFHATDVAGAP